MCNSTSGRHACRRRLCLRPPPLRHPAAHRRMRLAMYVMLCLGVAFVYFQVGGGHAG